MSDNGQQPAAQPNNPKVARCRVTRTSDITVKNIGTGVSLTLTREQIAVLPPADYAFIHMLCPRGVVLTTLTAKSMVYFRDLVLRTKVPMSNEVVEAVSSNLIPQRVAEREGSKAGSGVTHDEQGVVSLSTVANTLTEDMWVLEYDIPINRETGQSVVTNPSSWLWRYGFRQSLSCWCLPDRSMGKKDVVEFLALLRDHGCVRRLLRYHPDDLKVVREQAQEELRKEIVRLHTSLIERIGKAADTLDKAQEALSKVEMEGKVVTSYEYTCAQDSFLNGMRLILKQGRDALSNTIACAVLFDETETLSDLFKGLREGLKSETAAFNLLAADRGRKLSPQVTE